MTVKEMIYCISIVFQVTGSILLLTYFLGNTKDRALHIYFPGTNNAPRNEDNTITLEKTKVHHAVVTVYKNRVAFILLALGYFGGIFGENTGDYACIIALITVVLTLLLLLLVEKVCVYIAKKKYPNDWIIAYDSVDDYVDTTTSGSEIDEICKF